MHAEAPGLTTGRAKLRQFRLAGKSTIAVLFLVLFLRFLLSH
jgi:hypothetical protein